MGGFFLFSLSLFFSKVQTACLHIINMENIVGLHLSLKHYVSWPLANNEETVNFCFQEFSSSPQNRPTIGKFLFIFTNSKHSDL